MQNFKPETLIVGNTLLEFDELPSTNSYMLDKLRSEKLNEGTIVFTYHQVAGRGQQNAIWQSDKGVNISASVLLLPNFIEPKNHFWLNKAIALAVCDTIKSYARGHNVEIKWPNDILIDDKKVAGILIENSIQAGKFNWSVVGVGINVNQDYFGPLTRATSITSINKKTVYLGEALTRLCKFLDARYLQLKSGKTELIEKDYLYHLFRLNEEALYKIKGKVFLGKLLGVTKQGELILQTDKEVLNFGFKEIEFIY